MNIVERLFGIASQKLCSMTRTDRDKWSGADSLQAVGELTAQWLEGTLQSQPHYRYPCDVDDAPGMREALIALNRAGFVTHNSQRGLDGDEVQQRAAVAGFCTRDVWMRLDAALADAPIRVQEAAKGWELGSVPVTFAHGEVATDFGDAISEDTLRDSWTGYGICHRDAVDELAAAHQIVIRDIACGQNRLWALLLAALEPKMVTKECADAIVTVADHLDRRWVLLIERGDGLGWALPGGKLNVGESPIEAALRELEEETGLAAAAWQVAHVGERRVVPDPRNTDTLQYVTTPVYVSLGCLPEGTRPPAVHGGDDAAQAQWVLADELHQSCPTIFPAHTQMLTDLLSTGV